MQLNESVNWQGTMLSQDSLTGELLVKLLNKKRDMITAHTIFWLVNKNWKLRTHTCFWNEELQNPAFHVREHPS